MQAIRLTAWESPAELVEVPTPEPVPGEVLLRVAGAGLCHSDLHLMHWRAGSLPYERLESGGCRRRVVAVPSLDGAP